MTDSPAHAVTAAPYEPPDELGEGESVGGATTLELMKRYVRIRHESGMIADRTAQQMRYRLWDFAEHAPANPRRIRPRHVEAWLATPNLSPNYRRGRLSSLRGFCRWAVARGHMVTDPTIDVPMPKIPPAVPKRMRPDEARALAAAASTDTRTALVVSLMLQEALRRIEIARLDIEDIDSAEHTLAVRGKGARGHVDGVIPISDETWALLVRYLADEGDPRHGPLIRNRVRANPRMAPTTISELVRDAMVAAGVKRAGDPSRTPHSCRHTAAHDMLAATRDVRAVQQALRHASVRSTEVYLRGQVGNLREVMGGRRYRGPDSAPAR